MPTKPNKNLDVLNRRQQVAHLYLQNWTQAQIAEHLHVGQPTISADLQHIRRQWRESGLRDFETARELELQKIDLLEREAWAAWERSKKPTQSATVDGEGAGQRTRKTMRNQVGDPRFLDQVNKCIAQRRAILGLDTISSLTGQDADVNLTLDVRRVDSLPSLLRYATESELREMEQHLPLLSPATFATAASLGKWKSARHLAYLDRVLTDAIDEAAAGRLDGVIVSMPPQHGKSELCSKYLPAWYLGTFSDRRVILTSYEADFASGWGRKARDLLEQYGSMFGVKVSKRSKAVNRWDIEGRDGGMTTAGVGGPITGKGAHTY